MKRHPCYIYDKIANQEYLIPFGQAIEEFRMPVKISHDTARLWEILETDSDPDVLLNQQFKAFDVPADNQEQIRSDTIAFLNQLRTYGVIIDQDDTVSPSSAFSDEGNFSIPCAPVNTADTSATPDAMLCIAGIRIQYFGHLEYLSPEFDKFREFLHSSGTEADKSDRRLMSSDKVMCIYTMPYGDSLSNSRECGNALPVIINNTEITVYDAGKNYLLRFKEAPRVPAAYISKDGSKSVFYINDKELKGSDTAAHPASSSIAQTLFHGIRHAFLIRAEALGMYMLHSVSVRYQNKAMLFSALSGTGKTTHASIWQRLFDTPIINGDLNLLCFRNGRPYVCGTPWCGTSGVSEANTYPLGAIILIARSPEDRIEELPPDQKALAVCARFISPKWTETQAVNSIDFACAVSEAVPVARLHCNMEDEAAIVCRNWIDSQL